MKSHEYQRILVPTSSRNGSRYEYGQRRELDSTSRCPSCLCSGNLIDYLLWVRPASPSLVTPILTCVRRVPVSFGGNDPYHGLRLALMSKCVCLVVSCAALLLGLAMIARYVGYWAGSLVNLRVAFFYRKAVGGTGL